MKKRKLLMPLVTCASVTAAVVPLVTSCGPASCTKDWYKDKRPEITPFDPGKGHEQQSLEEANDIMFNGIAQDPSLLANEMIANLYDSASSPVELLSAHIETQVNTKNHVVSFKYNSKFYTPTNAKPTSYFYDVEVHNLEYQVTVLFDGSNGILPVLMIKMINAVKEETYDDLLDFVEQLAQNKDWWFSYKSDRTPEGEIAEYKIDSSNIMEYVLKTMREGHMSFSNFGASSEYLSKITIMEEK